MWTKVKVVLSGIGSNLLDIWNRTKVAIIVLAGVILALEFNKIKEALLVNASKKEIAADDKKDASLASQESNENKQADQLVNDAAQLNNNQPPVKSDWYKDSK